MKKYYRIFEIVDGAPVITAQLARKGNWFDTAEDAERGIMEYNNLKYFYEEGNYTEKQFTILPVYEQEKEY